MSDRQHRARKAARNGEKRAQALYAPNTFVTGAAPAGARPRHSAHRGRRARVLANTRQTTRHAPGWSADATPLTTRRRTRRSHRGSWSARLRGLLAVTALAGLGALAVWIWTASALRANSVRVVGTTDPELVTAVRALPMAGCFVLLCDTQRDAALVEGIPTIARAQVSFALPGTLVIDVTPRTPALVWRAYGDNFLVGGDGVVIGLAGASDQTQLAAVDDPQGAALTAGNARAGGRLPAALVEMAVELRSRLPGIVGHDVTLSYDRDAGLVADDGHGLRIAFGDPSQPPNDAPSGTAGQLAELRVMLDAVAQRGQRAAWIDLRWGTHPAYRLADS